MGPRQGQGESGRAWCRLRSRQKRLPGFGSNHRARRTAIQTRTDGFATAEFYRDVLGFTFDEFFGDPPSFTIVQRDDVGIMFRQVRPASLAVARPNSSVMDETFDVYVYVSHVDQLAAELRARNADIVEGPVNRICHMRELLVRDCNGYVLAFGQAAVLGLRFA